MFLTVLLFIGANVGTAPAMADFCYEAVNPAECATITNLTPIQPPNNICITVDNLYRCIDDPRLGIDQAIHDLPNPPPAMVCEDFLGAAQRLCLGTKQVQYVLIPHPDDEFESWPMFDRASDNYVVFIVLTRGERTSYCAADARVHWQPLLGEDPVVPEPVAADTPLCQQARLNSWHSFLDRMATIDTALGTTIPAGSQPITVPCSTCTRPAPGAQGQTVPVLHYDLYVGPLSARMAFDFGDQHVDSNEVAAALRQARALTKAQVFPITREYGAIAAAYHNDAYSGCHGYNTAVHPDHDTVRQTLLNFDFDLGGGNQWARAVSCDSRVATWESGGGGNVRRDDMTTTYFSDSVAVQNPSVPNSNRLGILQRVYGWLRGPSHWQYADKDNCSTCGLFNRVVYHVWRY
jgi:hypothetical protein